MKVWISKYALTTGVYEAEGEVSRIGDGSMFVVMNEHRHDCFHGDGREWHRTKEGALARAEDMRLARIESLKRSIVKMEKLKIRVRSFEGAVW